jgi:hypothetical protein
MKKLQNCFERDVQYDLGFMGVLGLRCVLFARFLPINFVFSLR